MLRYFSIIAGVKLTACYVNVCYFIKEDRQMCLECTVLVSLLVVGKLCLITTYTKVLVFLFFVNNVQVYISYVLCVSFMSCGEWRDF